MGRVDQVTSERETILNRVDYAYDGWGNEICEWQEDSGAAEPIGNSQPANVQYVYDDGAVGGVAQYVRLSDLTYRDGRVVAYTWSRSCFGR